MPRLRVAGWLVVAVAVAGAAGAAAPETEGESCLLQTNVHVARKNPQVHAAPAVAALPIPTGPQRAEAIAAAKAIVRGRRPPDFSAFLDPSTCVAQAGAETARQAYAFVCSIGCTREYLDKDGLAWAHHIRHQDRQRDIVLLLAEGDPTRPTVEQFVAELNDSLGRVHLILQPDELARPPAPLVDVMEEAPNCCGWREMRNLWVFNLTQYDQVMFIEMDVRILEPVEELWRCGDPLIGTIGPWAALNTGWYVFRPGAATFASLLSTMETTHYDHAMGWGGLGQPRPYQPMRGRAIGSETMQGFLEYYYFALGHGGRLVDMAVYNYIKCLHHRNRLAKDPMLEPRLYDGCWHVDEDSDSNKVKIVHKRDAGVERELARVNASVTAWMHGL